MFDGGYWLAQSHYWRAGEAIRLSPSLRSSKSLILTWSKFIALFSLQSQSFMTSRIISCLRKAAGVRSSEGIVCKDVSVASYAFKDENFGDEAPISNKIQHWSSGHVT